jgi:hypothetical protein
MDKRLQVISTIILTAIFIVVFSRVDGWAIEPIVDRSVHGPFHFRDFRTVNSAGVGAGDFLTFGVDVLPNGDFDDDGFADSHRSPVPPTTVVATQGTASIPLNFSPSGEDASGESFDPNHFVRSIPYEATLTDRWNFIITNDGTTITQLTGAVGTVAPMPKVKNMSLSGSGPTPRFNWSAPETPTGLTLDAVTIEIRDFDQRNERGVARRIFNESVPNPADTSFTVPAGVLFPDHKYSVGIQLDHRRSTGGLLSRSRSFFDFSTVLLNVGDAPVFLPSVDTTNVDPQYLFDVTVVAGQTVFIDPPVAIGYDYQVGSADPHFESVLLPAVGDNLFDLYLWNPTASEYQFHMTIGSNIKFDFPVGGVDRFRVLGIEPSAGLDPNNATAFVTGLTFVSSGQFTGTMTPIISETVSVKIKPGDGPNCINPKSKGVVPVTILGNAIDVEAINATSIEIDDDSNPLTGGVSPDKFSIKDVNGDGKLDLVLQFRTQDLSAAGLLVNGEIFYITGEFLNGTLLVGSDVFHLSDSPTCN